MEFEDLRERYRNFYMPAFSVTVGDREIRERDGLLTELEVDTTLDGATYFSFTIVDPLARGGEGESALEGDGFEAGQTVDIAMGYGDQLEPIALGRVHSVRPEFPSDGGSAVAVGGYGLLHDMMRVSKSASWDDRTDSEVVEEVASDYEFAEVDVETTGTTHPKVIQNTENDYLFLRRLADRNGFEVFARRDTFLFRAPQYDADPTLTLRYGESLHSFAPELSNASQVGEVEVRHWDPKRKTELVGTARGDESEAGKAVFRIPVQSREEAERVAEAALGRITAGLLRGTGEITGLPELLVGEPVRIEGLGERFSSNYYVYTVNHRIGQSGYWTVFDVRERAL